MEIKLQVQLSQNHQSEIQRSPWLPIFDSIENRHTRLSYFEEVRRQSKFAEENIKGLPQGDSFKPRLIALLQKFLAPKSD